jgi:hypothetical protein
VTVTQQSIILDFESGNLSGWTITSGNAFSAADVCTDANWGWGGPFNQQGSWHLWGFKNGGDAQVGELRSSNFILGGNGMVTAMVGGGNDLTNLYVALCRTSDNLVINKVTGNNDEAYVTKTLNGSAYIGTQCYIRIYDNSTGGFGHINVDNVVIPGSNPGGRLAGQDGAQQQSLVEESDDINISVYPNPVTEDLVIEVDDSRQEMAVSIFDLTGRVILENKLQGSSRYTLSIRGSHIPPGVIFLKVLTHRKMEVFQVIVK